MGLVVVGFVVIVPAMATLRAMSFALYRWSVMLHVVANTPPAGGITIGWFEERGRHEPPPREKGNPVES
jgi:hypothetical protein